jgi:cell division protein FtsQ
MDDRVRDRRRMVGRERGRRRAAWLALAAAVLVGLGLFLWLRSSDVFAVKRVVATATHHVDAQTIAEATATARGANLLRLRLSGIEQNLLKIPYVRAAEVHRRFPDTLEVSLEEYQPVACVQAKDGSRWLVADDGRVLERRSDPALLLVIPESRLDLEPGHRLPAVLKSALSVVEILRTPEIADSLPAVASMKVSTDGEVALILADEIELRLGEPAQLEQKLKVAGTIIQQCLKDGKRLEYVDARVPDRAAAKTK